MKATDINNHYLHVLHQDHSRGYQRREHALMLLLMSPAMLAGTVTQAVTGIKTLPW
ncbi:MULTISPECIES: hypothetical protein [Halomonadaceae]|uniref:hypothetical protein n=1 Tax=Halomonadaceae TaxID=28256 RepID=UPI00148380F0|nr:MULTISPECIES: hypothetical protein [Halomonas]MBS3669417.1 hypothetical protein [Halomonas boliviensis]